jgi:hypothetical protein
MPEAFTPVPKAKPVGKPYVKVPEALPVVFKFIVNEVGPVTAVITAPAGMDVPLTIIPGNNPSVEGTYTIF